MCVNVVTLCVCGNSYPDSITLDKYGVVTVDRQNKILLSISDRVKAYIT